MNVKRDIYIRVENMRDVRRILHEIKEKEDNLKALFEEYDKLNSEENQIFENWNNYLEDISQRMDHLGM